MVLEMDGVVCLAETKVCLFSNHLKSFLVSVEVETIIHVV